jgi:UDP-3-O-[3-hydroxymyristoyl] N-acetylglucosamine deacetylase
LNAETVKALLADKSAFDIVEASGVRRNAKSSDFVAVKPNIAAPWAL